MTAQKQFSRLERLSLSLLILSLSPFCTATCYGLDGNTMSYEFEPCNNITGAITTCCASNRTNYFGGSNYQGATADRCLPNGLCHNVKVFSPSFTQIQYWRNGCTTTPVDAEHCLNACIEPEQVISGGFAIMTPCDGTPNSTTWCCGEDDACCGTESEVTLAATIEALLPSSSATTTTRTTTTASNVTTSTSRSNTESRTSAGITTTSSSSSTNAIKKPDSLSTGVKAGIAISATVAALALIALIVLGRRYQKHKAAPFTATNVPVDPGTPLPDSMLRSGTRNMPVATSLWKTSNMPEDQITASPMISAETPVEKDGPDNRVFELKS